MLSVAVVTVLRVADTRCTLVDTGEKGDHFMDLWNLPAQFKVGEKVDDVGA